VANGQCAAPLGGTGARRLALALLSFTLGCASGRTPEPQALPPQSTLPQASSEEPAPIAVTPEPAEQTPQAGAPSSTHGPGNEERKHDPTVVMIDPGGRGPTTTRDVVAAARAEKERRKASGPPVAVINDKNLSEMGKGGRLTTGTAAPAGPAAHAGSANLAEQQEAYWRDRVRSLRERWKLAAETIGPLQEQAANLRAEFYSVDDPFRRDTEVKPAWDLTLEKLDRAKREVLEIQAQLAGALEEGRRSGALPGWLREGTELEPRALPRAVETVGEPRSGAEPREPNVLDEKDPPR
jgi:hypothetical protein